MKTRSLSLVLLAFAVAAGSAHAGVRVEVDPGAPFTEADLADAVEIRAPHDGDVVVHVAKLGMDQLVVIVGDKSQIVTLPDRDRAAASRVVALVVTGMLGDEAVVRPAAAGPGAVDVPVVAAAPRPFDHRMAFGVGGSFMEDDDLEAHLFADLVVARSMSPHARLVGSLVIGQNRSYDGSKSAMYPLRVGYEVHAGPAAVELGGEMITFRETYCGGNEWGLAAGTYGAGKLFLPLGSHAKIVTELGGQLVHGVLTTTCDSRLSSGEYAGWLRVGFEWAQ